MKRILLLALSVVLILTCCISVSAHPGKTDAAGGHMDNSTGEYHYHHGYPAHSHAGGCPYDYDDKTNHHSSNSSSDPKGKIEKNPDKESSNTDTETVTEEEETKDKAPTWKNILGITLAVILCSPLILTILAFLYYLTIDPIVQFIKKKIKNHPSEE